MLYFHLCNKNPSYSPPPSSGPVPNFNYQTSAFIKSQILYFKILINFKKHINATSAFQYFDLELSKLQSTAIYIAPAQSISWQGTTGYHVHQITPYFRRNSYTCIVYVSKKLNYFFLPCARDLNYLECIGCFNFSFISKIDLDSLNY